MFNVVSCALLLIPLCLVTHCEGNEDGPIVIVNSVTLPAHSKPGDYYKTSRYNFTDGEIVDIKCSKAGYPVSLLFQRTSTGDFIETSEESSSAHLKLKLSKSFDNTVVTCCGSVQGNNCLYEAKLTFSLQHLNTNNSIEVYINNSPIHLFANTNEQSSFTHIHRVREPDSVVILCQKKYVDDNSTLEIYYDEHYTNFTSEQVTVTNLTDMKTVSCKLKDETTVKEEVIIKFDIYKADLYISGLSSANITEEYKSDVNAVQLRYEYSEVEDLDLRCHLDIKLKPNSTPHITWAINDVSQSTSIKKYSTFIYTTSLKFKLTPERENMKLQCVESESGSEIERITIEFIYKSKAVQKLEDGDGAQVLVNSVTLPAHTKPGVNFTTVRYNFVDGEIVEIDCKKDAHPTYMEYYSALGDKMFSVIKEYKSRNRPAQLKLKLSKLSDGNYVYCYTGREGQNKTELIFSLQQLDTKNSIEVYINNVLIHPHEIMGVQGLFTHTHRVQVTDIVDIICQKKYVDDSTNVTLSTQEGFADRQESFSKVHRALKIETGVKIIRCMLSHEKTVKEEVTIKFLTYKTSLYISGLSSANITEEYKSDVNAVQLRYEYSEVEDLNLMCTSDTQFIPQISAFRNAELQISWAINDVVQSTPTVHNNYYIHTTSLMFKLTPDSYNTTLQCIAISENYYVKYITVKFRYKVKVEEKAEQKLQLEAVSSNTGIWTLMVIICAVTGILLFGFFVTKYLTGLMKDRKKQDTQVINQSVPSPDSSEPHQTQEEHVYAEIIYKTTPVMRCDRPKLSLPDQSDVPESTTAANSGYVSMESAKPTLPERLYNVVYDHVRYRK